MFNRWPKSWIQALALNGKGAKQCKANPFSGPEDDIVKILLGSGLTLSQQSEVLSRVRIFMSGYWQQMGFMAQTEREQGEEQLRKIVTQFEVNRN